MPKKISTRIIQKHDLEVNWLNAADFIPMQGELIIYDSEIDADGSVLGHPADRDPYDYARFKIGDGVTNVNELPFVLDNHTHISSQITDVEWMATRVPTESTILLQETTVSSSIVKGVTTPLQAGAQYVVYWNGEAFHQVAKIEDGTEYLGNLSCLNSAGSTTYEDTGEPFFIQQMNKSFLVYRKETGTATLKVVLIEDLPQKLPSEFLTEHSHVISEITDAEWIATSDTASATVIMAKQTTSTSSATTSLTIFPNRPSFTTGVTYKVEWDDTCYYVTPVVRGSTNCLGNLYLVDSTKPNTGEPFFVQPSGTTTKITVSDYSVAHKIKILLDTSIKMPARFLPDSLTTKLTEMQTYIDSKADSSHTHTQSEITNFPSSMQNPYPLTINGISYTGATSVSVSTPKAFYITVTNDGSGNYSSDKTLKETVAAYRNNNSLFVLYDGKVLHPYEISIVDVPEVSGAVSATLTFTNNEHSQTNNITCDTYVVDLHGDYYLDNENLRVYVTTHTYQMQTKESVQVIVDSKLDSIYENMFTQDNATLDEAKKLISALDAEKADASDLTAHINNKSNPHEVTKSQVGLGNVDNKSSATIRSEITSANVTTALGYIPLNSNLKGAASGVAELDANGKVPSSQLPSYVDDVIEGTYVSTTSFKNASGTAITGETGKIYVDTATNKTYRWSGSAYTEISASLALGETSSTAYRGDRGKIAYDHSQTAHAPSNAEANVQSDWNVTDTSSDAYIKNKPTIPTVNNATLTIQRNGTNVATFTANSSSNATANITVPTGAAADKGVDTSISAASTSTNLPTSKAVAAFVEGKGYKTTDNNTTYQFATGDNNGQIKVTPSGGSATNVSVKGLGSAAYTESTAYAPASHGTHVSYGTSAAALGTSSAGSATTVSRSDHVHALPALTSCTGTLTVAKGGTGYTSVVDTKYTTARYRASSLHSSTTSPSSNGTITWTYE